MALPGSLARLRMRAGQLERCERTLVTTSRAKGCSLAAALVTLEAVSHVAAARDLEPEHGVECLENLLP